MSNIGNLAQWLRKTPQPHTVLADDQKIPVPHGKGGKWRDICRTIETLGATKIVALDAHGQIIRGGTIDDDEPPEEKKPIDAKSCPTCGGSLNHFASLLADGYEKGSKSYAPLIKEAMAFVQEQSLRLAQSEREIDKLRAHNHKLQAEILVLTSQPSEGEEGAIAQLAAGFLQAQAGQQAPAQQQNGKGVRK